MLPQIKISLFLVFLKSTLHFSEAAVAIGIAEIHPGKYVFYSNTHSVKKTG